MWVTVHTISGIAVGAAVEAALSRTPQRIGSDRVPAGGPLPLHQEILADCRDVASGLIAALSGPVSHAVLDAFPHWDYTRHRLRPLWAAIDVTVSVATLQAARAAGIPRGALLAGALAALPDADVIDAVLPGHRSEDGPPRERLFPSHRRTYPHGRASPLSGTLVQLGIVGLSAVVLAATRARAKRHA